MFCNQCGQSNSNDANFCSSCGTQLEIPNTQNKIIKQQPIQTQTKQIELWNPNAAANWSLLFTPIFGSYLQFRNWQALGKKDEADNARNWFIVSILFILFINLGAPFIWSDPVKLDTYPRSLGFLYLIVWYFAFARIQPKYVKEKLRDKYQKKSWTIPLLTGLVIVFVSAFILLVTGDVITNKIQSKQSENISNTNWDNGQITPPQEQQATSQSNYFDQFDKKSSNKENTQTTAVSESQKPWEMNWSHVKKEQTNTSQSELEQAHYNAIFTAHPDAKSIVESQDFNMWVNNQPADWRNYYNEVLNKGNSTQVIEMLNDYKNGVTH